MRRLVLQVDALLRGKLTRREDLGRGEVGASALTLALASIVLGASYGAFMGLFAVLRAGNQSYAQILSSAVKVPLLFLLTLFVTFPSLYVFSTLAGSHLAFPQTLRLLLGGTVVNLALLASFGPITAFFTLSTESYPFMVLLNVIFFAAAGIAGLAFIARALGHVFSRPPELQPQPQPQPDPAPAMPASPPPVAERRPASRAAYVFQVWVLIYAVVGAQMGWILRPFVGSPDLPFTFIRQRESNFFEAVAEVLRALLGGG
jgi:hypothetical protein